MISKIALINHTHIKTMKACDIHPLGTIRFRLILLLQLTVALLHAQQYLFKTYNRASGLPSDYILCIYQDRDGFFWFGTDRGACRYDGKTYIIYTTTDGLGSNFVISIFQDHSGAMWFGLYEGGVTKLDRHGCVTFNKNHGFPGKSVINILQDSFERLYFDTDEGICVLHHDTVTCLPFHSQSRLLALVKDGSVLIEDSLSFSLIQPSADCTLRLKSVQLPSHVRDFFKLRFGPRHAILRKNGNVCLVGIPGLIELTGITSRYPSAVTELSNISIESIVEDSEETIWCGTELSGIIKIAARGKTSYMTVKGVTQKRISATLCDYEGNLWFGTMGEGVHKLLGTHVLAYDAQSGLPSSDVTTIFQDSQHNTWFGTRVGIAIINNNRPLKLPPYYATMKEVRAIGESAAGYYIGTFEQLIGPQTLSNLRSFSPPPFRWVGYGTSSLYIDQSHSPSVVWLSTYGGGTFRFSEHDTMQYFERNDKFFVKGNIVSEMIEGIVPGYNSLWFLSRNLGASRYKNGSFENYSTLNGLPSNAVYSVYEQEDGVLWFGTDAGVARLTPHGTQLFSSKEGLKGKYVLAIIPVQAGKAFTDSKGEYWIVSDQSLHKYTRGTLKSYGSYHILPSPEASMNSVCPVNGGSTLWLATTEGGMKVDLSKIHDRSIPPRISITSAHHDSVPFFSTIPGSVAHDNGTPITLASDQNRVSISFSGLSFYNEKYVSYAYKLSGLTENWSRPIEERIVRFHNLDPGQYEFAVVAINPDGVRSLEPARIAFVITPPFWSKAWFFALLSLAFLGMLSGSVRYLSTQKLRKKVVRLERERELQLERERTRSHIARDLHDDISSTLGSIALYSESLKRQSHQLSERQRSMLERIGSLASEAVDHMGDIVWSVDPGHDTFNDLLSRMRNLAVELCSINKMEYEIDVQAAPTDFSLAEDVRRNIYLTFKEALNNIIKHSRASRVTISAHLHEGLFEMMIEDDGNGFRLTDTASPAKRGAKQVRPGHGLRNLKQRAAEIGANLEINSVPGKGTTITFRKRMT
ncbi:MAG: two-component regulator propeller domain-containing protein [bacterium]